MRWTPALLFAFLISSGVASAGTVISVQPNVPTAAVGEPITFTVGGTNPCGAAHINYGDGTAITYAISGLPVAQSHAFEKPGTYAIVARGMGNCDGEATTKVAITGQAAPPPAPPSGPVITGITFAPNPGVTGQPVVINVAGEGSCAFTVNFGDGNQQDFSAPLPKRVDHTYALAKTYTVIVAPAAPCTGKFTEKLQVSTESGARITDLTIDPSPTDVGRGVLIVVEGVGTCTYRLDYGDGNHEDRSTLLPDRLHHVYNTAAAYPIVVVASGTCDGRVQRTLNVR